MSPDDGRVVSWPQRRVELGGRHGTRFKNGTPHKRHEPGHGSPKHGLSVGAPLRSFFGFRILPKETRCSLRFLMEVSRGSFAHGWKDGPGGAGGAGSARQVPRAIGGMLWGLPLISAIAHRR